MKRKVVVVLVAVLMIVAFTAQAVAQKTITIRYADVQAENDTETLAARKFAELVAKKSNGRIEVKVFPAGQLGDMKDIMQSVQTGTIEMCRNNPGWIADAGVKRFGVLSLPFIFDSLEHADKVIEGPIGKELLAEIEKSGLGMVGLGYFEPSLRYFFFKNKEVKKLSDMKGMKLRVPTTEINAAMVNAFGASATPIAYNELYTALQSGIVDGAENPLKGFINMKFSEVAKYFTFTGHQYEPSILLVSESFWKKLSASDQTILQDAMSETSAYYKEISKSLFDKLIAEGKKAGVKFTDVDNIKEWQDAVAPLIAKYGKGMEDMIQRIKNTK
ncbi:MAG TPA: TRAP transporter substrate-binding protein [Rectinemataceae bacterium]|nr:TRAP transporter substrate-binding protein [Rectinemataceae bacterium]